MEVTAEAVRVLHAASPALSSPSTRRTSTGAPSAGCKDGTTLPAGAMEDLRDHYPAILFGALGDPRVPEQVHARDILLGLRFQLDLYINLGRCGCSTSALTPLKGKTPRDIDMLVFRENTEGLYAGVGGNFKKGTPDEIAINEDVNTRKGVERILRAAFEAARGRRKERVHERQGQRADLRARPVAAHLGRRWRPSTPTSKTSHLYVDVAAMEMVRAPERFDVLVTSNMFGDILTDLGAAIAGGLGLAASGNIHPGRCSLFEPVHGSAPDIAGQGRGQSARRDPVGGDAARSPGRDGGGARAGGGGGARAVDEKQVTRDLGGELSTRQCGEWVADVVGKAA